MLVLVALRGPRPHLGGHGQVWAAPTRHHTGLRVGSHPWHPPTCPDKQDPSPGGLADPQVAAKGVPVPTVPFRSWGLERAQPVMRPPRIPHIRRGTLTSSPTSALRVWGHWEMLAELCRAELCQDKLCQAELCQAEPCRRRGEQEAERGGGDSAQTPPRVRPNQFWRPLPAPPHRPGIRARAAAPGAGGEGAAVGTAASPLPPAGTAPPCPHPHLVPAPTQCHRAQALVVLRHSHAPAPARD